MTFTEAAVEILRLAGRPLHYKKITELAIERNLLSHVGKSPELTMSSRLATMVKKDRGVEPIVKVKPGIFALREFTSEMLALVEESGEIELPAVTESSRPSPTLDGGEEAEELETETTAASSEEDPTAEAAPAPVSKRPPMPGAEVFPEEDDDDQPILAGLDEEEDDEKGDRKGRRRRRRRGRSEEGEAEPREAEVRTQERERPTRDRDRDRERSSRDRDRDRGTNARLPSVDLNRTPEQDDLLGRDLADAIHQVLGSGDPSPASYASLAEQLVKRGRLAGDPQALVPTVAAAIRADARRRDSAALGGSRDRQRFRHVEGRIALTEWYLPRDAARQEREAVRSAERQQELVRRAYLRKLEELPAAGFVELLATWLNTEGVSALRAVRRPTSSTTEIHLAGVLRRGPEEIRVAIVLMRDGRELSREKVTELRGSLHHYGSASAAWLVSTGPAARSAREEASAAGGAPVALFGGLELAMAMEHRGVGLISAAVPISTIDLDLLDALRGASEPVSREAQSGAREHRDRDPREPRERDRDRDRDRGRPPAPSAGKSEVTSAPAETDATASEAAPVNEEAGEGTPVGGQAKDAREQGEGGGRRRRRRRRRGRGNEDAATTATGEQDRVEIEVEEEGTEDEQAASSLDGSALEAREAGENESLGATDGESASEPEDVNAELDRHSAADELEDEESSDAASEPDIELEADDGDEEEP